MSHSDDSCRASFMTEHLFFAAWKQTLCHTQKNLRSKELSNAYGNSLRIDDAYKRIERCVENCLSGKLELTQQNISFHARPQRNPWQTEVESLAVLHS